MEDKIFAHMETVRAITEESIRKMPEALVDIIPPGYSNNIRWNFGHIVLVQERLVFFALGEKMGLPPQYETYFAAGTSPSEWTGTPPTLEEIAAEMASQKQRIKDFLSPRLGEALPKPFINKAGIQFNTVAETFLFSFFHEGMHLETIKRIYRAIPKLP